MIYFCSQKHRRALVLASPSLNGIDFLEVVGPTGCGKTLALTFLKDARALALTPDNFSIAGNSPVRILSVEPAHDDAPFVLTLRLDDAGDFSPYQLSVVAGGGTNDAPEGFDPQLASITFSFKAGCPTPSDCSAAPCCSAITRSAPDINYLAKDYGGFRQVMLDRLATLVPSWTETHAADVGVTMIETLAYAADHLSYQQDAVSTEAYLGTARSRISLRRHARLIDYTIGEGCNARTLVVLALGAGFDNILVPAETTFHVKQPGLPTSLRLSDPLAETLTADQQPIFSSIADTVLFEEQNCMRFYTWNDANCCLPAGSTQATLVGHLTTLTPGDMLIFEEVLGPETGNTSDANPANRCAVLLTSITSSDYKGRPLSDPLTGQQVTRIQWADEDAIPFPLCVSSTTDAEHGSFPVYDVSVARGNVVPAQHGVIITSETLPSVGEAPTAPQPATGCMCNSTAQIAAPIARYHPRLGNGPLTFSPPAAGYASATSFLAPDPKFALPQILSLVSSDGDLWVPLRDLLTSSDTDRVFVVEVEHDGSTFLRFGDNEHGQAAETGQAFTATYRVGNGSRGNIGRDALGHLLIGPTLPSPADAIVSVRNPLAASGGVDSESRNHIIAYAPFSYTSQIRCVTADDYGTAAAHLPGVREARGTLRWTGSWYTAFVSLDTAVGVTPELIRQTGDSLDLLRMMGTDLSVEGAHIVGLRIEMSICVEPAHFQGDVYDALSRLFITGDRCNGQPGLLNANQFSFGETVYASTLIAAAQSVDGVRAATLTSFARMDAAPGTPDGVAQGYLAMGRLEIPRCDNDPSHLDRGIFLLHMDGGK